MINLIQNGHRLVVDAGELVSYIVDDHEYIHQKGSPGWRSSDTEMFPLIGPTQEAGFKVKTARGYAVQDQHGLLREMDYKLIEQTNHKVVYLKKYETGTLVKNSKFPEKSSEEYLSWPYNFEFQKSFELVEGGLKVVFEISGEEGMPFMLGYHPAFRLQSPNPTIRAGARTISLQEVLAVGNRALPVLDCDMLILADTKTLAIETKGFGNFMLWTEVPNMICIEPITFYPYNVAQQELHKGFQTLDKKKFACEVVLRPNS